MTTNYCKNVSDLSAVNVLNIECLTVETFIWRNVLIIEWFFEYVIITISINNFGQKILSICVCHLLQTKLTHVSVADYWLELIIKYFFDFFD